jgi:hypothetical protein
LKILGRLADGVGPDEAQAQVAALGRRLAAEFPDTHGRLEAQVVPFGTSEWNLPQGGIRATPGFYAIQLLCLVLLLVACANVAMLIFARTATRFRELAIRTALGAGRARVVSQMFIESLLLASAATALGLPAYSWAIRRLQGIIVEGDGTQPAYWIDLGVTTKTVLWSLLFATATAGVVGILPALKVTGKRVQQTIQKAQAGRSGIRFGGVTGALIVADVAIAVTAVGFAMGLWGRVRASSGGQDLDGIAAEQFLGTTLIPTFHPAYLLRNPSAKREVWDVM